MKSLMNLETSSKHLLLKMMHLKPFVLSDQLFLLFLSLVLISWKPASPITSLPSDSNTLIGEPADKNTVALWLFDETAYPNALITDASIYEIADLALTSGTLVSGKYGNALSSTEGYNVIFAGFAGNGALQPRGPDGIPSGLWGPTYASQHLNDAVGTKDYTFEFWLSLEEIPLQDAFIFDMGRGFNKGFAILMNANGSGITINNSYAGFSSVFDLTSLNLNINDFTHFLFAMDKEGKGNIYLNGKKEGEATVTSIEKVALPDVENPRADFQNSRKWDTKTLLMKQESRFNLALLEDRKTLNVLTASIDEIRISDTIRASVDFIPGTYSRNYSSNPYLSGGITGLPQLLSPAARLKYNAITSPLEFGIRKHLFIDTKIIESGKINNLQLTRNNLTFASAEKTNISKIDGEWRMSFVQDGERMLGIATANYNSNKGLVYLYETTDGLNFTWKQVNMVNYPMGGDLFMDSSPNSIAEGTKFKLTAYVSNRGIYMYTSPDAMNWRRNETAMLPLLSGGSAESFYDDQTGSYVCYIKRDASFGNAETPKLNIRTSCRFSTYDPYSSWPFKKMKTPYFEDGPFPAVTGEGVTQFIGSADEQVYRTRVIKYPYAADTYLGFPWLYHASSNDRDVTMAVSRDGNDWSVLGKPYYVDKGAFAEGISCQGLFRKGNELWQYFEFGSDHGSGIRQWYRFKQRLDGFCSLDATDTEGSAITKSLKVDGINLSVNYKSFDNGYLRIQILDSTGSVIPGFESVNCVEMNGDNVARQVKWSSGKFSDLKGKAIKIQFIMKSTKLYAFETTNFEDPFSGMEKVGEAMSPKSISIQQNYPNPFSGITNIEFEINETSPIRTQLKVYNLCGEEIDNLLDNKLSAGRYKLEFNAQDISEGIYFYRLTSGNATISRKMAILK